jgi:hypothetical protein
MDEEGHPPGLAAPSERTFVIRRLYAWHWPFHDGVIGWIISSRLYSTLVNLCLLGFILGHFVWLTENSLGAYVRRLDINSLASIFGRKSHSGILARALYSPVATTGNNIVSAAFLMHLILGLLHMALRKLAPLESYQLSEKQGDDSSESRNHAGENQITEFHVVPSLMDRKPLRISMCVIIVWHLLYKLTTTMSSLSMEGATPFGSALYIRSANIASIKPYREFPVLQKDVFREGKLL